MTTNFGQNGAQPMGSTRPLYAVTQIGAGPDLQLMNFAMSTPKDKTCQPVGQMSDETWAMGFGDGVLMRNQKFYSMFKMVNTLAGSSSNTHGRPLVISQTGNLPVPQELLDTDIFKESTVEDQNRMMREWTKRYLSFLGISLDTFIKEMGPTNTPDSAGLAVVMDGLMSTQAFTGAPLPPFVPVVWDLIADQQVGRNGTTRYAGNGSQRFPITYKQHDPHNPTEWIKTNGRIFTRKLENKITSPAVKFPGLKMLNVSSGIAGKTSVMMEADANTCKLVMGVLGLFQNFISKEIDVETDNGKKDGLKETQNLLRGIYKLIELDKTKNNANDEKRAQKSVVNLCKAIFEDPSSASANAEYEKLPQVKTLQRSALPLLCHAIQDTAASTNQIVGRTMGIKTNSTGVKANSGTYTYDILFK